MSQATLTAESLPRPAGARLVTLDCPHGATTGLVIPGGGPSLDVAIVRTILAKHYRTERCRCTRALRVRYGLRS